MVRLVITEKPSVALDIVACLGGFHKKLGFFERGDCVVTWAIGHLVKLAEPGNMCPLWQKWTWQNLPMLPSVWFLEVIEATKGQYHIVESLLNSKSVHEVVCATDAGREGELIFRYIYEKAGCEKPIKRLWLASLTDSEIKHAFTRLQSAHKFDNLAASARARSQADWLLGLNLSRAYSLICQKPLSIGRVQTPTLRLIVEQDFKVESFKPEHYYTINGLLYFDADKLFKAHVIEIGENKPSDWEKLTALKIEDSLKANLLAKDLIGKEFRICDVKIKKIDELPPLLYDLSTLQKDANNLFHYTAQQTLEIAQELYEKYKLISYPRTESKYLTEESAKMMVPILDEIVKQYEHLDIQTNFTVSLGSRYVNQAKIADHHAIIPVSSVAKDLNQAEKNIFDLICRRTLMAWQKNHTYETTQLLFQSKQMLTNSCSAFFWMISKAKQILEDGWKALNLKKDSTKLTSDENESVFLKKYISDQRLAKIHSAESEKQTTSAPSRYTDASLVSAMVFAGRRIEDKELSQIIAGHGLGTAATRAGIIESLIERGFVKREKRFLMATEKGRHLIEIVSEKIKSVELTAQWEQSLLEVEQGKLSFIEFMSRIEKFVSDLIKELGAIGRLPSFSSARVKTEITSDQLYTILKSVFGHSSFRDHQEEICQVVANGHHILCVMPTGAGKSLCYQLPGIARGGVTLVISPLIALMEDQTTKLTKLGLRASYLHSGISRERSREICKKYRDGLLDFLFITPERLSIGGFVKFLASFRPNLIAVDEAHCISHWGHDFRSEYRNIGQCLKFFDQTPVIALTATATQIVQKDIISQLHLKKCKKYICGFLRKNIGIEIYETLDEERLALIKSIIKDKTNQPAIVYVATRKLAEDYAINLKMHNLEVMAYHAGMESNQRSAVQSRFLNGDLQVLVATVAFGMGVDKKNIRTIIHASLPSSLEGYYQEIGRAGRDGLPAKAILLYTGSDQRTCRFLFETSYPNPEKLKKVLQKIPPEGIPRDLWLIDFGEREKESIFHHAKIHNLITYDDFKIFLAKKGKLTNYTKQRNFRQQQLELVLSFIANSSVCRMCSLVSHFGEIIENWRCQLCDVCLPETHTSVRRQKLNMIERQIVKHMLHCLSDGKTLSQGRLWQLINASIKVSKEQFSSIVVALNRAGICACESSSFIKEGKKIHFVEIKLLKHQIADSELENLFFAKPVIERKLSVSKPFIAPIVAQPAFYDELKNWRLREAKRLNIPAFRILSNKILLDISEKTPKTIDELAEISGIGSQKIFRYGEAILAILSRNSNDLTME